MRTTVILSTYNQPEQLELCLSGYSIQTHADLEVVVADDGSSAETRSCVEAFREETGLEVRHVWHEDRGFRKCRILNRAIVAATGAYLVFSDGDCIPRRDFVATHVRLATPRRFISGGRCYLSRRVSQTIGVGDVIDGRAFDAGWWLRQRLPLRALLKIAPDPRAAGWLDHITSTRATWNGHNASCWKDDIVAINGFDERLAYGGEDRELGERFENSGVRPLQARHRAVVLHLHHARPYVDRALVRANFEVRRRTTGVPHWASRWFAPRRGPTATDFGIRQLPVEPADG